MEDLLDWRDTGLTGAAAAVLFHVVRLYREDRREVKLSKIVFAITDEQSPFKQEIKVGTVRTTAARLKKAHWKTEPLAYLTGGQDRYVPEATFVADPEQARLALSIDKAKGAFADDSQNEHIEFLIAHKYCERVAGRIETTWKGAGRFTKELEYLERLATLSSDSKENVRKEDTGLKLPPSGTPLPSNVLPPLFQTDRSAILTPDEVDILMALWHVQFFEPSRRGLTLDELAALSVTEGWSWAVSDLTGVEGQLQQLLNGMIVPAPESGDDHRHMIEVAEAYRGSERCTFYRLRYGLIGWPPAARMLYDLIDNHQDSGPDKKAFVRDWSRTLQIDPRIIEKDCILYSFNHQYVVCAPDNDERILPSRRAKVQELYIKRVAERHNAWLKDHKEGREWARHSIEWRKSIDTQSPPEISVCRTLTAPQAAILLSLRNHHFRTNGESTSAREIASELKLTEEFVFNALTALAQHWRWKLVEATSRGFTLAWPGEKEGAVSHFDTAYMLVHFRNVPRNAGNRLERSAIVSFLRNNGIDEKYATSSVDFSLKNGYMNRWDIEDDHFLTERVECEWLYLKALSDQGQPGRRPPRGSARSLPKG